MFSIGSIKQLWATIISIFSLKFLVNDRIYELTKRLREIGLEDKAIDLERKANELIQIHNQILLLERALFILIVALIVLFCINYRVIGGLFKHKVIRLKKKFQKKTKILDR
jgi:hypothetical protein